MGLLERTREQRASIENPSTSLANPAEWLVDYFGGGSSQAGPRVNEDTALDLSAFWVGIKAIAEDLSKLGMGVYERTDDGRRPAPEHPLAWLIRNEPNAEADLDPFAFRESMTAQALMRGNGYAEIEFDARNRPVALWPLPSNRVRSHRINGERFYGVRVDNGREILLEPGRVFHLRGFGTDPWEGISVLGVAKHAIGLGLAMQQFGSGYFSNGARPAGVIKREGEMTEEAQARLRRSWEHVHKGLDNSHRVAILDEGMDYESIGFNPSESQMMEGRNFQVVEVARYLRMPPHKVMELTRATYSNIEQQDLEYVRDTLLPWAKRWEQQANRKLFVERERNQFFVKINFNEQLRADTATRGQFYQQGLMSGWLQINDVRALEDMNPVEGGDQNFVPLNMIPLDSAADMVPPVPSEPDPDPDDDPDEPEPEGNALAPDRYTVRHPDGRVTETGMVSPDAGESRAVEVRQHRSITERHRLQRAQFRIYRNVAERLIQNEAQAVRRLKDRHLGERAQAEFEAALRRFYADFEDAVAGRFGPLNRAYSELVYSAIADELALDEDDPPEDYRDFVETFTAGMAARHTRLSFQQMQKLLRETDPEEHAAAVEKRLTEWEEGGPSGTPRAEKLARMETVRAGGAFAVTAYTLSRVIRLVWRTVGENCPYCTQLDGTTVSIGEPFAVEGDTIQAGDLNEGVLNVKRTTRHPPIHGGCDCLVGAAL